ncbi:energy-coupling factor transporter transmembrane protein EcfT [Acaricomes phytoseiuli]|uniref:energy-coupling factor transporter transmembrane component T family protein n=1 Tax=Acaricomes phytoseiuli TaxID=291968 RepID=UPI00038230E6|nr:energy-coupling factor transporter transmembrane protein EcfT [Acaricomes phytoseiuli]MCW1250269.1 energy-coupling factor transporter transmembrane protein EcfT [Acaricomes phytoseiuli]
MRGHNVLIGRYLPGDSPLHRAGYPVKLLGMFLIGLLCTVLPLMFQPAWAPLSVLLALILACYPLSGLPLRMLWGPLALLWPVLLALSGYQLWAGGIMQGQWNGLENAAQLVTVLLSCVYAAALLSLTTPVAEMLDSIASLTRATGLHRLGVDPERLALTTSLMFRSIPMLLGAYANVREAARARGLERSLRAHAIPTAVAAVGIAESTAEALAARGLGD